MKPFCSCLLLYRHLVGFSERLFSSVFISPLRQRKTYLQFYFRMVCATTYNSNGRIKINVRGTCYETYETTLCNYPDTLLGDRDKREKFFDCKRNEYYFDCKSEIFDAILFFYQSHGILAKPSFCNHREYQRQLQFFGLARQKPLPPEPKTFREKLWTFLQDPHQSSLALIAAYLSFMIIVASVITFCAETESEGIRSLLFRSRTIWFHLECFFIGYFTLEYLIRLFTSPDRLAFIKSFYGVVDLIAIVPFYFSLLFIVLAEDFILHSIGMVRIVRLIQILRIMKLSRYSTGLRVLGKSLFYCKEQMFSLGAFFAINVIFVSSIIYIFEHDTNDDFNSIPQSMWFIIISMTTVGYGDVVPKTIGGKLTAVLSIFIGAVVLFHLFLPTYLMYFTIFYTKAQQHTLERKKREAERKSKRERELAIREEREQQRKRTLIDKNTRDKKSVALLEDKLNEDSDIEITVASRTQRLTVDMKSDFMSSSTSFYSLNL